MSRRHSSYGDGWKGWPEREQRRIAWEHRHRQEQWGWIISVCVVLLLGVAAGKWWG